MARQPPKRAASPKRGPRTTDALPDRSDARKMWSGAPYQRSPGRWSGSVDFGRKKHTVPTADTPREWGRARDELLATLKAGRRPAGSTFLDGVTIAQFVGAPGADWPWTFPRLHKRARRSQPQTFRHHEQCIRAFVAEFGDRPIKGGVSRQEAGMWSDNEATENQVTSAIALYNDAFSVDDTVANPLFLRSRPRTRGRADMPNVLTRAEVDTLREIARAMNPGEYGIVMAAMVELMATAAPRPGELWAMERSRLRVQECIIYIRHAVKKGKTLAEKLGPPKYDQKRDIVLAPSALELIAEMPQLHERWLFPTRTGQLMSQSNWTTYWHPVRAAFAAQLPDGHWLVERINEQALLRDAEPDPRKKLRIDDGKLDFYELRHRAITFMATPKPDGLGLDPADIARQVGHRDGGHLVRTVYVHIDAKLALARIRDAMHADTPAGRASPPTDAAAAANRTTFAGRPYPSR
jgi:integrase